jgi:hypothetical protein
MATTPPMSEGAPVRGEYDCSRAVAERVVARRGRGIAKGLAPNAGRGRSVTRGPLRLLRAVQGLPFMPTGPERLPFDRASDGTPGPRKSVGPLGDDSRTLAVRRGDPGSPSRAGQFSSGPTGG